jgi:anti-sigma regulatory factor (Ser/Thr protein kinase)
LALRCDASAPRCARTSLSQVLPPGPPLDDAILVASELVTNAVHFSGCTSAERIGLHVALHDGALCVAVHDPARTQHAPEQLEHDPERIGGHGLRIVAQLALRWGVETHDDGRCVWAELALPDDDPDWSPPTQSQPATAPASRAARP